MQGVGSELLKCAMPITKRLLHGAAYLTQTYPSPLPTYDTHTERMSVEMATRQKERVNADAVCVEAHNAYLQYVVRDKGR